VASYQLHSTLDFSSVLEIARDIVINMLGAEVFGIYLVDERLDQLVLVVNEGYPEDQCGNLPMDEATKAALTGSVQTDTAAKGSEAPGTGNPLLVLPLQLEDRPIGIVYVYKLLLQKQGFQAVDFELIELLGKHAATAIYSAQLHARSERKRTTLEGVMELIRSSGFAPPPDTSGSWHSK
ncbi:MAG TPA: GAF domain-containing protein, partial [Polyangiaceae bacterium]|nr:GAF domain-containing protein [Polyangiaceae bacterium]